MKNIKEDLLERISNLSEEQRVLFKKKLEVAGIKIDSILNLSQKNKAFQSAEFKEYYPISPAQNRLYLLYKINKNSLAYNSPVKLSIGTQVDKVLLKSILHKLIERHECLRTAIIEIKNEPVQIIHNNFQLKVDDYQIEKEDLDNTYKKFIRPFDLSITPAIRVALVDVINEGYYLFMDIHHIFEDLNSALILSSELRALATGKLLPPLNYHYKDYCQWQFHRQKSKSIKEQEEFWIQKFKDNLPNLNLPIDFPRPKIQSNEGAQVNYYLDKNLTLQIGKFAKSKNFTLPMVFIGAYSLLLSKICGQEDIIIGMPISGRYKPEFDLIIGMFANTLPVCQKVDNQITLKNFLGDVKNNIVQVLENQEYLFENLVEKVVKDRDLSHHPIFEVLFNFGDRIESLENIINDLPDSFHKRLPVKFDLSLMVVDYQEQFLISIEYCTKLFKPDTIDSFMNYYKKVLDQITIKINDKVRDIELISNKDKHRILNDFNNTRLNYPKEKTIHELFEEQVNKNPEKLALITKTKQFTYNQLNAKANSLAKKLRQKNIKSNSLVGIMVDRTPEMLISILSVLKSGGAYLPIDPEYPKERIEYMILDSETRLVISQKKYITQFSSSNFSTEFINIYNPEILSKESDENVININKSNDLAYIIYTSGSTGKPKGVMLEHRNINNFISGITSQIRLEKNKNILCLTTISFDIFVLETHLPLTNGYTVVLADEIEQKDPKELQKLIIDKNVDLIQITPSRLKLLLHYDKELKIFSNVDKLLVGGEPFHEELFKNLKEKYHNKIYNMYGPTETSVWSSTKNLTETEKVTIGKPISNTQIYILDKNNLLCPIGIPGELCIGGDGLARGYLNREELTNEKFITFHYNNHENSKLYKTGDLAKWLPDGDIEYLERIDNQVKIRGFRIELGEVELSIVRIKGIMEAVVVAKDDINGDKRLVAYIVTSDEVFNDEIKTGLAKSLPNYMIPSVYIRLDKIPLTPNGKLNVKALPEPEYDPGIFYIAPRNNIEELLAGIWETILGLKKVGVLDNFFTNGGDSIKAIAVSSGMLAKGYNVNVQDILKYQTIKDLAPLVCKTEKISDQSTITGKIALTPIQQWFFSSRDVDEHLYNQAVMLYFNKFLTPEIVSSVFGKLLEHHDALRMIFYKRDNKIYQENIGLDYPFSLEVHSFLNEEDALNEKFKIGNRIKTEINLENGPLIKLGLFQFNQTSELLIVIHNLLVDTVSWRIIFEDIDTLFKQHNQKMTYHLPQKTDSFKLWSEALKNYENSPEFEKEKSYWQNIFQTKDCYIKKEFKDGSNTFNDAIKESFILTETLKKAVLTDVHKAFGTQINDVLLAALQLALEKTFGMNRSIIELEDHGREEVFENLNVNRTVGQFTYIYPVLLESGENILDTLVKVKESLRSIPNKGIGYGVSEDLLKYRTSINNYSGEISHICFNNVGLFNLETENKVFKISTKNVDENISLKNNRVYELNVSAFADEKCLRIAISYSQAQYKKSTIQKLRTNYEFFLKEIISGCLNQKNRVLTPSDLTFRDLPIDYLNDLQKELSIQDIYPLSPMQEGMFYHFLVNNESLAYFNQNNYSIKGALDLNALKNAGEYLLQRYDILRAQFLHGQFAIPLQVILNSRDLDFSLIDVRSKINGNNKKDVIEHFLAEDRKRKFNLLKDILMRVSLLQLSENEYELLISFHHILMDGWCRNIVMNDFMHAYQAYKNNSFPSLPPAKQYVDYVKWIQNRDNGETGKYWEDYLAGYNEPFKFPSSNSQTQYLARNQKHEVYQGNIGIEKTLRLKGLANKCKITLNTLVQAAWGILLCKYANKKDVVFGSVVSGRPSEISGIERMVGLFINTIPVRIQYTDSTTIYELLLALQEKNIDGTSHHYYPLAKIQAKSLLGNDLINHVLAFENLPDISKVKKNDAESERENASDLEMQAANVFQQSNYDLDVVIIPREEISISFIFNSNVFSSNQIKNLVSHLELIFDTILKQPELGVNDIDILSHIDKQKILCDFNDTDTEYSENNTIIDLLENQVDKTPGRIAVSYEDLHFSYDFVNNKSNELANILIKNNIKLQEPVAVILDRDINAIIGLYAILKCGGTYTPIEPGLPIKRIKQLIKCSNAEVIICNLSLLSDLKEFLEEENTVKYRFYCLQSKSNYQKNKTVEGVQYFNSFNDSSTQNPALKISSDNFAYIIYTSGSTGLPKGVMVKHKPVINLIEWVNKTYKVNEEDKMLFISSLSFDLSVYDIFGTLSCGGCVRIVSHKHLKDPLTLLNIIIKEGITFWDSAPAALLQLIPYMNNLKSNNYISSLRLVFLSGDWIPLSISDKMKQTFNKVQVIGLGGATEATVWSNHYNINKIDKSWKSIPYGKPISNAKYYILNDDLQICPIGAPGNLYIGGNCLATGYINDIDTSCKKFIKSPFKSDETIYSTGDMARWYEDGNIEFLGRKDFQVKIRGHRIELGEIDYYLNKHNKIDEVVTDVKLNQANDKVICAYYISKEKLNSIDLTDYIKEYVPDYMVPDFYIPLESFPVTSNGKLDRKLLPKPSIQLNNSFISPRNQIEFVIHSIWQKVLSLKENEFGVNSNFFELGGHSLKVTEVIAEFLDKFKKQIPIQEFIVNPTIEHLANIINDSDEARTSKIKPAERKEYYRLSQSQTRFYVLQQLGKSNSYNISIAFEMIGETDFIRLEKVMYQLICRHENLRTCFKIIDGKPYQFISDAKPMSFDYFEASNKEEIGKIIAKYPKVYDLGNLFLFSLGCIKISKEKTIFILDIHHIIADAISLNILMHEFVQLYNENILPENTIQYKDFSEWSANKTQLDLIKKQELYWLEQFKEEVPEIRLYQDKIRPRIKSFKGKNYSIKLPDTVLNQLQEFAYNNEVTLNVLLFSYFNILISKISGITDINIGSVVSGRRRSEVMNSIGAFVNTLVLRNYPTPDKSFKEFLKDVKQNMFDALENQDYQYEALIAKLEVERNTDRNPLFELMYVYNDQNENKKRRNDSNIKFYPPDYPIAKFDLTLEIWITDKIDLTFNYCTDIFNDQTIEKISNQYEKIILDTLAIPECLLNEIEILNTDEKNKLLSNFNDNSLTFPDDLTILDMYTEKVMVFPDKVAVVDNDKFITYKELDRKGDIIAEILRRKGVNQEQLVGILLPRSIEMIECIIGTIKSGAAYLPMDITSPINRFNYQLCQANVKLLLTCDALIDKIDSNVNKLNINDIKYENTKISRHEIANSHNLLYLIFTSGTTDNPKGVLIENQGFVNLLYNYRKEFCPNEKSIFTLSASPGFDAMALELWPSLTSGSLIHIVPDDIRLDPKLLMKWMITRNVTISFQAPIIAENLIKQDWPIKNQSLKTLLTGGDKLNKFPNQEIPFNFFNLYGPTEDSVVTTFKKVEAKPDATDIPSIGKPLANKKVYILGKQLELLPIGVPGELYISGKGLARGYINNQSLNNDKFIQNPYDEGLIYDTGDLAMWLPNGDIKFLGRKDSQVKIRGHRVEIEEVRQHILKHEAIDECIVLVKESKNNEICLAAYYTSKLDFKEAEIRNNMKEILPNYMLPSFFIKINKFKLNINGKIDTKSLPDAKSISSDKLDLPKGVLENKLLYIWKEVLNLDKIGVGHNFFDIGGNSLKLIEVNEKIHEQLEIKTNVLDLIQYPTIRELSQFLKNSDPARKITDSELINKIDAGKSKMKDLRFKK